MRQVQCACRMCGITANKIQTMEDNTKNDIVGKLLAAVHATISETREKVQESEAASECIEGEIERNIRTMARGIVTALRMIAKNDEDLAETLAEEVAEVVYNYDSWEPAETIWPNIPAKAEEEQDACYGTPEQDTHNGRTYGEYMDAVAKVFREFTEGLDMTVEHDRDMAVSRASALEFALHAELVELQRGPARDEMLAAVRDIGEKYGIEGLDLIHMVERTAHVMKDDISSE